MRRGVVKAWAAVLREIAQGGVRTPPMADLKPHTQVDRVDGVGSEHFRNS